MPAQTSRLSTFSKQHLNNLIADIIMDTQRRGMRSLVRKRSVPETLRTSKTNFRMEHTSMSSFTHLIPPFHYSNSKETFDENMMKARMSSRDLTTMEQVLKFSSRTSLQHLHVVLLPPVHIAYLFYGSCR